MTTSLSTRKRQLTALAIGLSVAAVAAAAGMSADRNSPPLPPNKQAQLNHEYQHQPNAPRAVKQPNYRPPAQPTTPPPDAGQVVIDPPQVPLPAGVFTATSGWSDLRGAVMIHLYGGASASDSSLGEIYLSETNQQTGMLIGTSGIYSDPGAGGALTLTSVVGSTVSFTSPRGQGTFDLDNHRFSP
jgi:hypothetical protein